MFGLTKKTPRIVTDPERIEEALTRGVVEVVVQDDLKKALRSGRQLRVKLGIDPTGTNIHIGHAVSILKLRDFQELGHKAVIIMGDATGVIGDTSDKEGERPMLTPSEVENNKRTYIAQISKILDVSNVEVRHNSEWLNRLGYKEIGEQADQFSVADFIARDNIRRRMDAGKRVSLREVLYPLMQGYDSVAIKADVEIGGIDQKFNLLAGRTLQRHFGQPEQNLLMSELVEGTDGRKMSKSLGNTINVTDNPDDMYGKVMTIVDDLIIRYFVLCTRVSMGEVEGYRKKLEQQEVNPRDVKMHLAREIVSLYYGQSLAQEAERAFVSVFSRKETPEDVTEVSVAMGALLADVLIENNAVASKNEFRRLVEQGALHDMENNTTIQKQDYTIEKPLTLKIGKRRFIKISIQ